jgi:hypothetical protein
MPAASLVTFPDAGRCPDLGISPGDSVVVATLAGDADKSRRACPRTEAGGLRATFLRVIALCWPSQRATDRIRRNANTVVILIIEEIAIGGDFQTVDERRRQLLSSSFTGSLWTAWQQWLASNVQALAVIGGVLVDGNVFPRRRCPSRNGAEVDHLAAYPRLALCEKHRVAVARSLHVDPFL